LEASKWFTQVDLPPDSKELNEVCQLIIDSQPAQRDCSADGESQDEPSEHTSEWYLSLFTIAGKEWNDFVKFIKDQTATITFLEKRVVFFHEDTYIKQKLSLGKKDEKNQFQNESAPVSIKDVFGRQRQGYRKLFIEAEAGQGKTSLLRHSAFLIALAASQSIGKKTIGLYLRADTLCNEFKILDGNESKDRSGINLETVIGVFLYLCRLPLANQCQQHFMQFVKTKVDSIVLLIDSLDELSQAQRLSFLKRINQISNQGMTLDDKTVVDQIVIASRPISEGIAGFDQYNIESLTSLQQKTFIMKYFGAAAKKNFRMSAKLWSDMVDQPSLRQTLNHDHKELVNTCVKAIECQKRLKTQGNPLLLFLLCLHLEKNHDRQMEETRLFILYESIIKMTIERSQERLHSDPRFRSLFLPWQAEESRAWLMDLMTVTAFVCHWIGSQNEEVDDLSPRKERVSFVLSELQKIEDWKLYSALSAHEELLAGQDLVDVLVSLPGLCQLTREDKPSVYFVNRTIQEFLTARCALGIFDRLQCGREPSRSWSPLRDIKLAGIDPIPRENFWKNEKIVCSRWWSRVILFAASYDHSNETGLEWLWRSIDGPKRLGNGSVVALVAITSISIINQTRCEETGRDLLLDIGYIANRSISIG